MWHGISFAEKPDHGLAHSTDLDLLVAVGGYMAYCQRGRALLVVPMTPNRTQTPACTRRGQ